MISRIILLCGLLVFTRAAFSQVVITEIHYHPVEESAFDANGSPVLDLSDDVHEFVEIQNTGGTSVDLAGWKLGNGVAYTFPADVTLEAGQYLVIAKNPARLIAVYGIAQSSVLGPYTGTLGNGGDAVRLGNPAGDTVDQVNYSNNFPWAISADALGASDRFTGLNSLDYQYKGRSLQRVSNTWASGDPANWLASPLAAGPSPGAAQAVTRVIPKPVVVAFSAKQTNNGSTVVRANQAVTVTATFSGTDALSGVQVEYFTDDVNSTAETRTTVNMTALAGGRFTASVPGLPDRSVVRYRFRANRGDGVEVVSPRDDDPAVSPTGPGGARQAWHGYFVTPVRASQNPVYDIFVSAASVTTINGYVNLFPERVTSYDAQGQPREPGYAGPPYWNGSEPGIHAQNGEVRDIHIRHHGSRYHRQVSRSSFKMFFAEYKPFNGLTQVFETDKDWATSEGQAIMREAGLLSSPTRSVDWYFNNNAPLVRLEQGEFNRELLDPYHDMQHRLNPAIPREKNGDMYKSIGNIDFTGNNLEGPYTRGDAGNIAANAGWSSIERYRFTYSLQNNAWKGASQIKNLIDGMWSARGDDFNSPNINATAARTWANNNLNLDEVLTEFAILNWMGAWDDVCHNQFYWRRANGKWSRLSWDYDDLMSGSRITQAINSGEVGAPVIFFGPNWFKDTVIKGFPDEFRDKMWAVNNTVLDPENLAALGYPNSAAFAAQRQANVNAQLGLGTYFKPNRPTHTAPADGATVILASAALTTSDYSHSNPTPTPHGSTRWEIRTSTGTYLEPTVRITSTTNKTALPIPYDQLIYGQTYFWRATHIDTQGRISIISAETSFTWGNPSPVAGALVLHEIMADNLSAVPNAGAFPDYIELRNNTGADILLDGKTLSDDPLNPSKFAFPAGTTIPAGGFLTVYCDDDLAAPGLHTGFNLDADGQTVLLLDGGTLLDYVTFGPQAANFALGRTGGGTGGWALVNPSPGAGNVQATLGSTADLRINEWMAAPEKGDDYFELYNTGAQPVAIGGLHLSDNPGNLVNTRVPTLSYIAPRGFSKFSADGSTGGANHCDFRLGGGGDSILLTAADGVTPLQTLAFGIQQQGVSQGRLPDGAATIMSFPGTASAGLSNWIPSPLVINEVLSNSTAPFEDSIEILNPTGASIDIGGWFLSDDRTQLQKYTIPAGTTVPAGGYLTLTQTQFGASFAISSTGDEIILTATAAGVPTGLRAENNFGASDENVSFGSVPLSDGTFEFWAMKTRSFGVVNGEPVTGPIIINEINFHPPDLAAADNIRDEFIELHNITASPVSIAGWVLKGDSDFTFPAGTTIPAGAYILVAGFDPANTGTLAAFRAANGIGASVTVLGPYSDDLPNSDGNIELAKPGAAVAGVIPFILVDKVHYYDSAPWPATADGSGASLQRQSRIILGNDPGNWIATAPAAGTVNVAQAPYIPGLSGSPGTFVFDIDSSGATEGAPSVSIIIQRDNGSTGSVSVNYTTFDGTAFAGSDYGQGSGTISFTDGETSKSLIIPIVDNTAFETTETFSIRLTSATGGANFGLLTEHTVSIFDNEDPLAGTVQFRNASSNIGESAGTHDIIVERLGPTGLPVSIQVRQDSTLSTVTHAVEGVDFLGNLPVTVTFGVGEFEKNVTLTLTNDNRQEADKRIRLRLQNPAGGASVASNIHDVTLTSEDVAPPYVATKDGYTGLLNPGFVTGDYGNITFTTTVLGKMTGKLFYNGVTYPLSGGTFNATGLYLKTIPTKINGVLQSSILNLQMADGGETFAGTFRGIEVFGERNRIGTAKIPVPNAGKYTAHLRLGDANGSTHGHLFINILPTGVVTFLGALADKTVISAKSALSVTNQIPFCAGLYAKKAGYLYGPAGLAPLGTPRPFLGDLRWKKPAPLKPTGIFPNGFVPKTIAAVGARYVPPIKGQVLLPGFAAASATFFDGNLAPVPAPINLGISTLNKFVVPKVNAASLKLTLIPTTGSIVGSFKHSDGKVRLIKGVAVQQAPGDGPGILEAWFPGTTLPGDIIIAP